MIIVFCCNRLAVGKSKEIIDLVELLGVKYLAIMNREDGYVRWKEHLLKGPRLPVRS